MKKTMPELIHDARAHLDLLATNRSPEWNVEYAKRLQGIAYSIYNAAARAERMADPVIKGTK